jgi:hypothetical protein
MHPRTAGAVPALLVLVLWLTACTGPAPDGASGGPCHGIRRDQVTGPEPSYVAGPLAEFPGSSALCRGLWLPTADSWFVPQGLVLDAGTAWVSGYRWHRGYGARACRLLHVSLRTGRLLAATDRLQARVYGPRQTFCRHGGALSQDRHGLWVVESNRLWLVDPGRVGHRGQVRRVWRLQPPVRGSVLLDGSRAVLGVGTWRDAGPGRARWFRYRDLLAPGVSSLVAGRPAGRGEATAVRTTPVVRRVQGTTEGPAGARGTWSTSSTSTCGMLLTPGGRRLGFAPGAEEIEFDASGRLWAVLESGARSYQRDGRPLVPMLAQFDVSRLLRGPLATCDW